ncbi:MAG: hypothetical protein F6K55_32765 [Moorea sp. SIO4A3]|nr:hypothetical protein [Moorena sp. SIO4A3]
MHRAGLLPTPYSLSPYLPISLSPYLPISPPITFKSDAKKSRRLRGNSYSLKTNNL